MTTPRVFKDDDIGYLNWIAAHPAGSVLNANRTPNAAYVMLHRASRNTISRRPRQGTIMDCLVSEGVLRRSVDGPTVQPATSWCNAHIMWAMPSLSMTRVVTYLPLLSIEVHFGPQPGASYDRTTREVPIYNEPNLRVEPNPGSLSMHLGVDCL